MHKPTLTLKLTDSEKAALREIAANHGLTIGRGSSPETGSIREMLLMLASGDALFIMLQNDTDYCQALSIRKLAEENQDLSVLAQLANALERAGQLFYDR